MRNKSVSRKVCKLCGNKYEYSGRGEKAAKYCSKCRLYRHMTETEILDLKEKVAWTRSLAKQEKDYSDPVDKRARLTRKHVLSILKFDRENNQQTDLSWTDLRGIDLRGVNLSGVNFSRARLREADLSEADLSGANLIEADLIDATQFKTNFNGAIFTGARGVKEQKDYEGTFNERRKSIGVLTPTGGQSGYRKRNPRN